MERIYGQVGGCLRKRKARGRSHRMHEKEVELSYGLRKVVTREDEARQSPEWQVQTLFCNVDVCTRGTGVNLQCMYPRPSEGAPVSSKHHLSQYGHIKKPRHRFADNGPSSQSYGFSSSHAWMWELDHKEGWEPKNWCFWTMLLEKTLESLLDSKEIKPVNLLRRKSTLNSNWKVWCWRWSSNPLAAWCEKLTPWETALCWDRLREGGEAGPWGWDGWMASSTQWTWVWANSRESEGQGSLACCHP